MGIWEPRTSPTAAPPQTRLLRGVQYASLRAEFREFRVRHGIAPIRPSVERVLVSFGGSDLRGQTLRVLQLFEECPDRFAVRVFVTPYFADLEKLKSVAGRLSRQVEFVCETVNLSRLMRDCDLAITSAGVTSYELACLGVPFLVMKLYENQRFVYQRLIQEQIAVNAGEGESSSDDLLRDQFERCLASRSLRQKLQQNAVRQIDGRGAERVAEALAEDLQAYFSASLPD